MLDRPANAKALDAERGEDVVRGLDGKQIIVVYVCVCVYTYIYIYIYIYTT